jgi:HTH-type transcriptional regulator, sugar sensing transcriptional regulator
MKKEPISTDPVDASLVQIGLTPDQACIYKIMLNLGPSKAFKIAFHSGVKRALTYKVLKELNEMGLVESKEMEDSKVTTFSPLHPSQLEKLINKKKEQVLRAEGVLGEMMQTLASTYNHANKKPNVRFWEGVQGLDKMHDDIIMDGQDILLFRSAYDRAHPGLDEMIEENIKRRVKRGMKTRAITPLIYPLNKHLTVDKDQGNLVTRRFVKIEEFNLPAQITIYGDKVAIVSYKEGIMTTIIENKDIRDSAAILFELIWSRAIKPEEVFES